MSVLAGHYPVVRVDLNMLRGDRVNARINAITFHGSEKGVVPEPHNSIRAGDFIYGIDEEGVYYPAIVESVEEKRLRLRLDLDDVVSSPTFTHEKLYGRQLSQSGSVAPNSVAV